MYYLFLFDNYHPCGGMNDLDGEFNSLESALYRAKESSCDYYQVVDSSMRIRSSGSVEDLQ